MTADQVAKWRAAVAQHNRARRNRRGRRRKPSYMPGMNIIQPRDNVTRQHDDPEPRR